jgi:peptidoglycan/xylan/chitin deacetylase (PgdA/CDA1 family)
LGLLRVLTDDDRRNSHSQDAIVVRKATFIILLAYLKDHFELLPSEALVSGQDAGTGEKPACVVTFDDGWFDNYTVALPELLRFRIPATLLVATSYLGTSQTFWVERLLAALSGPQAAGILAEIARKKGVSADIDGEAAIEYLKHMPAAQRNEILTSLLPVDSGAAGPDRMMSWEQLRKMGRDGIDIGGHTATHPLLTYESDEAVRRELNECREVLQQKLGTAVRSFAYPNGDFDGRVRQAVANAGYGWAYTTREGWYVRGEDPYTIPRYLLHEGNITGPDGKFSPAMFSFTIAGWRRG